VVSATTACKMIALVYRVEGKHAVAGQLETVTNDSRLLGAGPHKSQFYYDFVLENGFHVRGGCKHVTSLLSFQSTID
jgi:hypothetical protein